LEFLLDFHVPGWRGDWSCAHLTVEVRGEHVRGSGADSLVVALGLEFGESD
jgi:hypothetical protein